jgi:hypothetical protein
MAPTLSMLAVVAATLSVVSGKIYFKEDFQSKDWQSRWTVPTNWKPKVRQCFFL